MVKEILADLANEPREANRLIFSPQNSEESHNDHFRTQMKHTKNLLGMALCLLACPIWLSAQSESGVLVLRLNGIARSNVGTENLRSLRMGETLLPGATVQTGGEENCFVDLLFDADPGIARSLATQSAAPVVGRGGSFTGAATELNVIRLWRGSSLKLASARSITTGAGLVSETRLELQQGRISGIMKKMMGGSVFEVRLPERVVAIQGGAFDISEDGSVIETTGSAIKLGWMDAKTGSPVAQLIGAGQKYDFRSSNLTPLNQLEIAALGSTANAISFISSDPKALKVSHAKDETKRPISPPGPPFPPPGPPPVVPPVNPPGRGLNR